MGFIESLSESVPVYMLLSSFFAGCASAGFAFCFFAAPKDILTGGVCGFLGWFVYLLAKNLDMAVVISFGAAAFTAGGFSEICAFLRRRPALVFSVPGIIPLVPGGGMYETMMAAVRGNMEEAGTRAFVTLCSAGAVAVGLAAATAVCRMIHRNR